MPGLRPSPLLAALALLLAGCAAPPEAPPPGAAGDGPSHPPAGPEPDAPGPRRSPGAVRVAEVRPLSVPAADGAALRGHVYLPEGEPPFAVVLGLGPYWGSEFPATGAMLGEEGTLRSIYGDTTYANLSQAGFAVALLNVRGTGASDGCYTFFAPADGPDAAAVVGALAAAPWSAGRVGMYGVSYDGWTQYAAMAERPPALRATVPVSGVLDLWTVSTRDGAAARAYVGSGSAYTLLLGQGGSSLVSGGGDRGLPRPGAERLCPGAAADLAALDGSAAHGDRTPAFRARDLRAGVRASGIPALATYGLALPGMPDASGRAAPWEGLVLNARNLSADLPAGSRILLGPWPHGPPAIPDFPARVVDFLDGHLRGGALAPPPAVTYFESGGGERAADRWPPQAAPLRLHLDGGKLSPAAPAAAPAARLVSSDRHPDLADCGPDKVVFLSAPLPADLHVAGSFRLAVEVVSSAPDGNLAAHLFALPADEGCPSASAREVGRALSDLRHRGHLEVGEPFPVGSPGNVRLESAPFAATLARGSRLALVVSGGDGVELAPKATKPALLLGAGALDLPVVPQASSEAESRGSGRSGPW